MSELNAEKKELNPTANNGSRLTKRIAYKMTMTNIVELETLLPNVARQYYRSWS